MTSHPTRRCGSGTYEQARRRRLLAEMLQVEDRGDSLGWNLTHRSRRIIEAYISGKSMAQIGREFARSAEAIRWTVVGALDRYEESRTRIAVASAYMSIRRLVP